MPDKKLMIQVAIGAAVAAVAFYWLQKSGLWAQMFSSNTFTDPQQLLAYCQANPAGTAVYVDQTGKQHSASCQSWIVTNVSMVPDPPAPTDSFSAPIDPVLLAALQGAAAQSPALGQDLGNMDQWNLCLQTVDPTAQMGDLTHLGVGPSDMLTARQFLALRLKAGLTSLAPQEETFENPMAWTN